MEEMEEKTELTNIYCAREDPTPIDEQQTRAFRKVAKMS